MNIPAILAALEGAAKELGSPLAQGIAVVAGDFVNALPVIEAGGQAAINASKPFLHSLETLGQNGSNSAEWAAVVAAVQANSDTIQKSAD